MFGLPLKVYIIIGACAAVVIFLLSYRHEIIVKEDLKTQLKTNSVIQDIEEKKNAIISVPPSDARTIDRLQHGTYFNR